jgi:transcriptional regulator with XRE-family HTH domain
MDFSQLGKRIRAARLSKGLTQEQLSELISCSSTHISHIENASTSLSMSTFMEIVNALQTTPDKLLCDNVYQSVGVLTDELSAVFSDANPDEFYMMLQTADAVKKNMRIRKLSSENP